MKIGLVGYQGSGKSTLFHWLTGVRPDPALSHTMQSAMAELPDPRIAALCEIYGPKKVTQAALELLDTPGLSRTHDGNASRLAQIREAGCLVIVVGTYDGEEPSQDLTSFDEDLLLADLEIVSGRIERLKGTIKKPRPDREQLQNELNALEPLIAQLEQGQALREIELTEEQARVTRAFQLLSQKPRLVVINASEDEPDAQRFQSQTSEIVVACPLRLALELAEMPEVERDEFVQEMGLTTYSRDGILQSMLKASGQHLFFTAGDKEVRSWLLPEGATAVEAAGSIHTDMARGFIRAETMAAADLIRLGGEREMKAQNLVRQEPKDYVVQDGDVILMKFNV